MLKSLFIVFNCFFFINGLEVDELNKTEELVFLSLIWRHGARTPISMYPNDPYKNLSYWPVGWGQLTNVGKEQHYELGKWLRKYYNDLLGEKYIPSRIKVHSTDVDRTLMSALSNLAGMFPPNGNESWNSNVNWQPIPVHTIPEVMDKVLAMKAPCERYQVELHKVMESSYIKRINEKYNDLFNYLTKYTGKEVKTVEGAERIMSALLIEELNNFTLPNWTKSVYPVPLRDAAAISFTIRTFNDILKKLKSGPLLGKIISEMKNVTSGHFKRKVTIYSAHDTTVSNLLNTLGIFTPHCPPFTATVIIELWRNKISGQYTVMVLYKKDLTWILPEVYTIPGCTAACPLEQFEQIFSHLIPQNWDAECKTHTIFDFNPHLPYNSLAIFAIVISTLLVFLLLTSTSLYWNKHGPLSASHLYSKLRSETI